MLTHLQTTKVVFVSKSSKRMKKGLHLYIKDNIAGYIPVLIIKALLQLMNLTFIAHSFSQLKIKRNSLVN